VILKFSSGLYSKAAVNRAVRQYGDFAKIKVKQGKKSFEVSFSGVDADYVDTLPGEFSNCALLAMQEGA